MMETQRQLQEETTTLSIIRRAKASLVLDSTILIQRLLSRQLLISRLEQARGQV